MITTTIWLANAIFAYFLFVHCDLGYGRENYRLLGTATIRVPYNSAPFATIRDFSNDDSGLDDEKLGRGHGPKYFFIGNLTIRDFELK
jgi:hypothetical protein